MALRPRERLRLLGERALSDAECVGLLLGQGSRLRRAEQVADVLLEQCGGLAGLARADAAELAAVPGVGPVRAAALVAACGLARRVVEARLRPGTALRAPGDVARLVREMTRAEARETFHVVLLDARHRVQGLRLVGAGSLRSAPVHPREVFGPALRAAAAAVVVAHNHPSGDPSPSTDDRMVTERLREVGELCGIEVLDHVVVGAHSYFSFAEERERPLPPAVGAAEGPR